MARQRYNYAVEQRQHFIDQMLALYGAVGRRELMSFFGIGGATATRDLGMYTEDYPKNLVYNVNTKRYLKTYEFKRGY